MRDMTTAMATALAARVIKYAFFAEFSFASAPLRAWNGPASTEWAGHTWLGFGTFVGVSTVDETTEVGATTLTFQLSGVPSSLLSLALADPYRGRPCRLWLNTLDGDDAVVESLQVWAGRMDTMSIDDGGETAAIALTAVSRLVDLTRPRNLRYTDQEQQRLFPADRGFEYTAKLPEKPLYWGVPAPSGASAPNYGG